MTTRRSFLKKSLAFSACSFASTLGLLAPPKVFAEWRVENFKQVPLEESLKRLFKDQKITESKDIEIKIPLIAENGAIVPITVSSSLPGVRAVSIFVAKNPVPLAVRFELSPDLDPFVSARLKMAETSEVIAVAETDRGFYSARQLVKVTIGGCGG
ncbi:thiosulfate oxidation carrier protein SoxY [Candidatus Methylomicrobium oryzae]|jgi:sulfur-oxidizing protein SoxY|uniref:thiosulfate oxidation carrier protein SoxY n=1 Tax=Candidatus Methylomicrobium oryzae TaxID=2802053 RepID=UPI0019203DD0|nr:thiosulfate oxidation carrier protein SoxY [Methylomicrobium sp. RS1]MBL1264189.1 thiosulfate oxidation carrier protein SoxY [Methylomicrobium sp. RS1]